MRSSAPRRAHTETLESFGLYPNGNKVTEKPEILFARIDAKEMEAKIAEVEAKNAPKPAQESAPEKGHPRPRPDHDRGFCKGRADGRRGHGLRADQARQEALKLTLNDGTGTPRTVASGIAKWYKPEDLVGRSVVVVSNLKPATLCGVASQGMILAADAAEDDVRVIFVDGVPAGAKIH